MKKPKKSRVIISGTKNLRKCQKCQEFFVQMTKGRPYCEHCFYSMTDEGYEV